RVSVARQAARAIAAAAWSDRRLAVSLTVQMRPFAGGLIAGIMPRIVFHRLVLALDNALVDRLQLPASWRWAFFDRAHRRAVRLAYLERSGNSASLRELPIDLPRCPMD